MKTIYIVRPDWLEDSLHQQALKAEGSYSWEPRHALSVQRHCRQAKEQAARQRARLRKASINATDILEDWRRDLASTSNETTQLEPNKPLDLANHLRSPVFGHFGLNAKSDRGWSYPDA